MTEIQATIPQGSFLEPILSCYTLSIFYGHKTLQLSPFWIATIIPTGKSKLQKYLTE